jgi:1-acyl-sn-glycerol-3-phosphate acyltransferase
MRYVLNALILAVTTAICSFAALFVIPFSRTGHATSSIARFWAKTIVRLTGVEVELIGFDRSKLDAPAYLVMANHSSHFDVIAMFATLPLDMRPVAKRELGYIPIFGWALILGAAIMIDRGARERAIASIERAGRAIREGRTVLMFPEGTRTPPGVLGPMKKGPFHLAQAARVPVLPIGIHGTGDVLLPGDWKIRRGRVVVRVGAPIPTDTVPEGDGGRDRLAAQVAGALSDLMRVPPGSPELFVDTARRTP